MAQKKKQKRQKPKKSARDLKKKAKKEVVAQKRTAPKPKPKPKPKPEPKPKPQPVVKVVPTPAPKVEKVVVQVPTPEPTPVPTPMPTPEKVLAKVPVKPVEQVKPVKKQDVTKQLETMMKIVEKNRPKEDIPSVEPLMPDYEQIGRGLVYNCEGGYWACLDKTNFLRCRDNMKWRKSNGKDVSCYTANVYASEEDCYKIQLYNINSIEDTSFCKKK